MIAPSTETRPFEEITGSKLLVVEGRDDKDFFDALAKHLDLTDIEIRDIGGKSKLRRTLRTLKMTSTFNNVKSLCVVRDADDYPDRAFQSVRDALKNAGLAVPEKPFELAEGNPRVAVMILPDGKRPGMLEDLCLELIKNDPAMVCVNKYFDYLEKQIEDLPKNLSKAKIHVFLASRKKPDLSLGVASQVGYLPWDSSAFDQIKRLLNKF